MMKDISMKISTPEQIHQDEQHTNNRVTGMLNIKHHKVFTTIRRALKNPWLKFGLRLGCTLLLFYVLFRTLNNSVSLSTLVNKLNNMDAGMLMIGLIVGLFGVIISSYQWQCLLDGERINIDLRKLVNLYLVGIAFNHFLPTGMGGDVIKAYYVGKEGDNLPGSASAVIMSRVTGFFGMLCVSIPTIIIWHTLFTSSITIFFLLSCLAMCATLGGTMLLVTVLPRLAGRWAHWGIIGSVIRVGQTIRSSCMRPTIMIKALLFGMIFHLGAALNYYCYAKMLHVNVPIMFYMVAIPFISLIAFLPVSLNGYGLREGALVAIFSTIHIPASTVLVFALLADVQALFFGMIGGLIYILMGQRQTKKVYEEQDVQSRPIWQEEKLPV